MKDVEWNMTPHHYGEFPSVVQKSTKRSREVHGDAEESRSERLREFRQQLLGVNGQGNKGAMDINAIGASIHRYEL